MFMIVLCFRCGRKASTRHMPFCAMCFRLYWNGEWNSSNSIKTKIEKIEINNVSEFSYLLSPQQSRFESMYDVHNNDRNAATSRTRFVQLS